METSEQPLVSVIIVVKNGERFIRQALESVFSQDYPHFEVIVVDGHSEDNTLPIVKEFSPDQVIIQKGEGISDAYNIAIKASRANFISFLSSDDLWLPDKLSGHIYEMTGHPEIMFTNSLIEYFLEPGANIPPGFKKDLLNRPHTARIMENLVARKSVFDKVGLFDTELSTAEDVDWYSRAQDLQIPSGTINKVLLKKRIHNSNISLDAKLNNKNLMTVLRETLKRKRSTSEFES